MSTIHSSDNARQEFSRRTSKLSIPDNFCDNRILVCGYRKDSVVKTSLTQDIAVQSFRTVTGLDDFTQR